MRPVVCCLVSFMMIAPLEGGAQTRVYLSEDEAIRRALHKADSVRVRTLSLTREDADTLSAELDMQIMGHQYSFYEAVRDGNVERRAVIVDVIGQHQPITFIVGILPDETVERVEIMVYREARGGEVRRRAFLKQFEQKSLEDPLLVNRDIKNITGATISSRSVADGVRLALILHQRLLAWDRSAEEE